MGAFGQKLSILVLGSGTSVGVPTIGCKCRVCQSPDPRDRRLRPSVLVRYHGRHIVVDTTPDFRQQALRAGLERLDAVLFTHAHADHILGLDDIRPLNFLMGGAIPIYGSEETLGTIRQVFHYVFSDSQSESSMPRLSVHTLDGRPFELFGLEIIPVPLKHGSGRVYGFRFGYAAYLTDHSEIPEESLELLEGLEVLFLDALRHRPHPTHTTVARALEYVERLRPKRAFFTHICHDLPHEETERALPGHVRLAYDGLEITVGGCRR
ncbi:MAG: MBL fold metallo-hydrolase [Bryobacteraceae bacterium]